MTLSPPDASAMAAEVRQLARQTHRLLNDPATDALQIDEISRRIERLRRQLASRPNAPVSRWLAGLEQRLPDLATR